MNKSMELLDTRKARGNARRMPGKLLLIMRLTAVLTLVFSLNLSAKTFSQTVTLKAQRLSLYEAFNNISRQTGYEFVYDAQVVKHAAPINIDVKAAPLAQVLNACLAGNNSLTYSIVDKTIVISVRPQPKAAAATTVAPALTITGKVVDAQGNPLIGVAVQVKGTTRGLLTNETGAFSIQANAGDVLTFSYLGYDPQSVTITGDALLTITMKQSDNQLTAVVVTALGVRRQEKTITYATQQLGGEELVKAKDPNLINTLNGKVAGLTISSSGSGVGGSAKVVLRGSKSGLGSNQALYVIDGVPMNNLTSAQPSQPGSIYGGSTAYDGGDPISNLNPDDIESISVLKGASASALYGSQGANGVIIITTKSGKAGKSTVNLSSGFQLSSVAMKPKFQNEYGMSAPTDPSSDYNTQSWGSKINGAHDNLDDFYRTGYNWTNSISLSGGNEKNQTYFSYANTSANGIEPTNKLGRNNITFKETGHFLNDKLTATGDVNYMTQTIDNTPLAGFYYNALTGLYLFPRGQNLLQFKDKFEMPDPTRNNLMVQNWPFNEDIQQNPWWIVHRNINSLTRNRVLANANLKYDVNKWLNFSARGSIDRIADKYEQDVYAGTIAVLSHRNGTFNVNNQTSTQMYGDFLANINLPVGKDFKLTGVAGTSILDTKYDGFKLGSTGIDSLKYPNIFTLQNMSGLDPNVSATLPEQHVQTQSVFASVNLSFRDWLFLDLTGRQDWSSALAYTSHEHYFYPSVGLNAILSQVFKLPEVITFAKVRGSYAVVGNAPLAYQSNAAQNYWTNSLTVNTTAPFNELVPEKTKSLEFGTEWRFFDSRLSADVTYYKTNTTNQTIRIQASQATYYDNYYINAGNIQNQGVEAVVKYDVIRDKAFTWNTGFNFSTNQNKIISLSPKVDLFVLSGQSGANYASQFKVGGSYGDIYGVGIQKDAQGRVMLKGGAPQLTTGDLVKIGNSNTKWQLGWNNNFVYKNFNLSLLVDGKFGGQVLSLTQSIMDQYGVSAASGAARDAGGVKINGVDENNNAVTSVDPQTWYNTVGGRNGASSQYIYSATTVRLREATLGYSVPFQHSFVKALKVSAIGRNLLYFYKKAPFDPEMTMSTANGLGGVDVFMQPAVRNYGLSVNATF